MPPLELDTNKVLQTSTGDSELCKKVKTRMIRSLSAILLGTIVANLLPVVASAGAAKQQPEDPDQRLPLVSLAAERSQRPFTLLDMQALERIQEVSFAPDSRALAFVRIRPDNVARSDYDISTFGGGDIWVQDTPGKAPRNLTQGAQDGSSWGMPQWSSDGQWLAMVSTRGGVVRLWAWSRSADRLMLVSDDALAIKYVVAVSSPQFWWIDAQWLICAVYPKGLLPGRVRPELPKGDLVTASPLESGVPFDAKHLLTEELKVVDVRTGREVSIGPGRAAEGPYFARNARYALSPDRSIMAVERWVGQVVPDANGRIDRWDYNKLIFEYPNLFTIELRAISGVPFKLARPLPSTVVRNSLRWSPDGKELTFFARGAAETLSLWRVDRSSGQVMDKNMDERQMMQFLSDFDRGAALRSDQNELSFVKPAPEARLIAISPNRMSAVYRQDGRNGLLLWRVEAAGGPVEELVRTNLFVRDIADGESRQIEYKSLVGQPLYGNLLLPVGYQPGRRVPLVVWVYAGQVYLKNPAAGVPGGVSSNTFMNLHLLAARGYAVVAPSMPLKTRCAKGFGNHPYCSDNQLPKLIDGVMPAVDYLIEHGIADPERLFMIGHSNGGSSVAGLATLTNRFKAGVMSSGAPDYLTSYTTRGIDHYLNFPGPVGGTFWHFEVHQGGIGAPPWKDWEAYRRNSALAYVERIHTPLLMLSGDEDGGPFASQESFFTGLYREGKRAEFVRYWGEAHGIHRRPANVRDMWRRIFAWYDRWGDIARDEQGNMIWDGDRAKGRNGAPPLKPEDYAKFDLFQPSPARQPGVATSQSGQK